VHILSRVSVDHTNAARLPRAGEATEPGRNSVASPSSRFDSKRADTQEVTEPVGWGHSTASPHLLW